MNEVTVIDLESQTIVPHSDYGKVKKYCRENDLKMPTLEGRGMVNNEIYEDGFLIRPLWLETKSIPDEGIEKVRGLYEVGVKFEGFFVVHETPWSFMDNRPNVTLDEARRVVDSKTPEQKSDNTVAAVGLVLALALGFVVASALLTPQQTPSLPSSRPVFRETPSREFFLDPLLVGVLHDSGRRVVCHAWLDEF